MAEQLFASGAPTKAFFVGMLTRDIELEDAILDLLDNCLDGVVRSQPLKDKLNDTDYYKGFQAEINISPDKFQIIDNCGGIPRDTAMKYAFRMGRSTLNDDANNNPSLPTVGIYGIGMKRAIFKIGKCAKVFTKHNADKYTVQIPLDWAESDDNWNFPLIENDPLNPLTQCGTIIEIEDINSGIKERWYHIDNFCDRLYKAIQQSYSFIIQKGFKITLNGNEVAPLPIELLIDSSIGSAIKPYVFMNTYNDVTVKIAIGFYAPPPTEDDLDAMNETKRTSNDAGITVVCNDRVVLYNDKSALTGWGTSKVPNYHTQFIGIKGIVIFESFNPRSLPMTTTKRGIDHSSSLYLTVKDRICDGLKMFTNYTNLWKGQNQAEREHSTKAMKVSVSDIFNETKNKDLGITPRNSQKGKTFNPQLPKPKNDKPLKIIRFSKSIEEIQKVSLYYFGENDYPPSKVGEECFNNILSIAKEKN